MGRIVLKAIKRWWGLALPVGLLLAGATAATAWWFFQPSYEAAAWFRIAERSPFVAFEDKQEGRFRAFFQTQIELIRSPVVLGGALRQPEVARVPEIAEQPDPIVWLSKRVRVASAGESELFRIAFACDSGKDAATVVNAIADTYFKLRDQNEGETNRRIVELLEQERSVWSKEVVRLQQNLRELAKGVRADLLGGAKQDQESLAKRLLTDLQSRLIAVRSERTFLEAQIKATTEVDGEAPAATGKSVSAQPSGRAADSQAPAAVEVADVRVGIPRMTESLALKRARLEQIGTLSARGKTDPAYERLADEVRRDQETIDRLRDLMSQEVETGLASKRRYELAKLHHNLSALRATEDVLKEQYETELRNSTHQNDDTLELELKRSELTRAENIFEMISERVLKLQTERGAPARVYLLQKAESPTIPVEGPFRLVLLGSLAAFSLPFLLAVVWESVHRRIGDSEHLVSQSKVSVLGEVARLTASQRATAVRGPAANHENDAEKLYQQSVDCLGMALLFSRELHGKRIISVTSAVVGEGKTSVSVQLALSIARNTGQPTLLIDGDMRSPDVHRSFSIDLQPGLVEVLNGECTVDEAIVKNWSQTLHLLPAGRLHVTPNRLLSGGAWRALLEQIPPNYVYIIVDTPPILAASESIVLSEAADTTLLCVMHDVSLVEQVKRARDRLSLVGVSPLAVLNGVPQRQYTLRYGRYYSAPT